MPPSLGCPGYHVGCLGRQVPRVVTRWIPFRVILSIVYRLIRVHLNFQDLPKTYIVL